MIDDDLLRLGAEIEAAKPPDPHGLAFYIRGAKDLLAGLTDTEESLTPNDRAMLERRLARAEELCTKDPLTKGEKREVNTFIETVGALGPRFQSLRNRAKGDFAAEIKAATNRTTGWRGRRLPNRQKTTCSMLLSRKRRSPV